MSEKELTAEDILNVKDITVERVEVPEWGGHIYVRAMSGITRERYVKNLRKIVGHGKNRTEEFIIEKSSAKLAMQTICDANGKLLFENKPEVIDQLAEKSSKALQRVVDAAARLNGLSDEAEAEAKNESESQAPSEDLSIV